MNDQHEHDYWRTPGGALLCACGYSRRPLELTREQQATVDRFGIFENDEAEL